MKKRLRPDKTETLQEMVERFNRDESNFIRVEALKIYSQTEKEESALKALEILERAVRY